MRRCKIKAVLLSILTVGIAWGIIWGLLPRGGREQTKTLPITGEVFFVEEHIAFLILPAKRDSDHPTPWVWYAPTWTTRRKRERLFRSPQKLEKWMFQKFLDAGIGIAGIDVGKSWGSPKERFLFSAFYGELSERRGLSKKACLLAVSRGGLMLYNWAIEHPSSVACIAGIMPVCNLRGFPELTEEELAAKIKVVHNPIDAVDILAKAKVPIFHIHGDSDTTVPLEKNSAELARRYQKAGGDMTLKVIKGQGHSKWSGYFRSQDLVDFVIAHASKSGPNKTDTGDGW
jgi:hypothetical protein